jgi:hypothetical protein
LTVNSLAILEVRQRAKFRCEYCETNETDAGGQLTIDHFQPSSRGGDDDLDNLVYCCFRCNLFKGDYWPDEPSKSNLFDPRRDKSEDHFWLSDTGEIFGLTDRGRQTIERLRLNRPPLVLRRKNDNLKEQERQLLEQSQDAVQSLIRLSRQQRELLRAQRLLLEEQRRLIELILRR